MPSKRDPNKKIVTFWLEKNNASELKKLADERGVPVSDLIQEAIQNQCELWGIDYKDYCDSKFSNRNDRKEI